MLKTVKEGFHVILGNKTPRKRGFVTPDLCTVSQDGQSTGA
jgi:hypothetical protein